MKKLMVLLLFGLFLWNLSACGMSRTDQESSQNRKSDSSVGTENKDAAYKASESNESSSNEEATVIGGLTSLIAQTGLYYRYCSTDDGFYYMTEKETKLSDGSYGYHLMYMDYATCQEVYLCSDSSCQHDTEECTAVFTDVSFDGRIFIWDGYLYYLDRSYDDSGSIIMGEASVEAEQVALYRMNLDGSERKLVYTFEANATVEDVAFGRKDSIYFIIKKLGTSESASGTYITTTDRQIVRLRLDNWNEEPVCSLDFEDGLNWRIIGCAGDKIVLKVYQYPNGITEQNAATLDESTYRDILKGTEILYATLDLSTREKTLIYNQNGNGASSELVLDDYLYVSNNDSEDIVKVDLTTGEKSTLTSLSHNALYSSMGNMLLCTGYDMTEDYGYYFVDIVTGEVTYCSLTNQSLGWRLDLMAEVGDRVLVVYDYEYVDNGDGSYTISQYQYGLIDQNDLLNSVANYTPIHMVGEGR